MSALQLLQGQPIGERGWCVADPACCLTYRDADASSDLILLQDSAC
jgi:hypothetical protein